MELMIAVAVLTIVVSVAAPLFTEQVRKSRRSEALAALAQVQQAQEKWRATNPAYAPNDQLTTGLKLSATTGSGNYSLAISNESATGYTATATAVSTKPQAQDTRCQVIAVRMDAGNLSYGSGTGPDWNDANRCWVR